LRTEGTEVWQHAGEHWRWDEGGHERRGRQANDAVFITKAGGTNICMASRNYCTFSFKSTGGVTRDPFYLFDISAAAEFLRDTPKISAFEPKISSFLHFLGSLETCVTTWRFDRGPSDA
jgi:hypothetical protein